MKIHISREEDDKNLFITQLREALASHPRVGRVTCGQGKFWNGPNGEDVLHIHWPEHLCPNQSPAELRRLHAALQEWQEQAAIVVTVHNEYPHYRDTAFYRAAYRLTYQHADGLIHLGHRSREVVRHRYDCSLQDTDEAVIPHGRYSWYLDQDFRSDSRSEYGYDEEDTVILSFGSVRRPEELELLLTGFEAADIPRKQLLVAGGVVWPSRLSLRHYQLWARTLLHPVQFLSGFISHEKVPGLLEVADVLVIPRKKALNSGNVALGYTFGTVVVGPDVGVIGEVLRETGNPTYDSDQPETMGAALEQGTSLTRSEKGGENRAYANEQWGWPGLADEHIAFFRTLSRASRLASD